MGLKVQLGHLSGKTCPYPWASGRLVVVIDVEGIHKINMMSFMLKVSGYEYYQSLARLHDNTGSLMLLGIVRKKTFGSTTRLWKKRAHVMIMTQLSSLQCMGVKGCLQVRMDLPTLLTLKMEAPKEVVIAYDISCQWGKNLWKRINVYGPDLTPPQKQKDILPVVRERWGQEVAKTHWMTTGVITTGGKMLGYLFHLQKMAKFDYRNGQSGWNHGSNAVQVEKKSKICTFQQSNMTLTIALGSDAQWGASMGTLISANKMITDGLLAKQAQLDLQNEMKALGPHSTDIQHVKVLDKTSRLQREINLWMEVQLVYMPEVCSIHGEEDRTAGGECVVVWNIDLLLSLSLLMKHNILCNKQLLHYEWELRCAQAMEALGIVRCKVILETYIVNHKGVYGHSQKIGTTSNNLLDICCMEKTWSMATYNWAHEALWHLAGPLGMTDWHKTYCVLQIKDAVLIAGLKQRKKRDTSSKEMSGESTAPQLSWIWLIAGAVDNSTPEGLQDALRIEWCKLQACMQCWNEECCLLHEEMQRVLRSHKYNIKLWSDRAERSIKGTTHGTQAYTFCQAFVHQQMKAYCE
ncbi:hypothetical protein EDD18DRAFT_1112176 [Armillaria luteobubalina]|uniref:CxC2-like cysteine cluster KDZ transposase-associated domain-containing protein n=1 Tax=Armillaria luteobubalina TaxID=153913 RepID=A0AA39UII6_9AGAR|nr:hypothetical protein EDD18DRAFT_1112176 [Armillaria luteobubalina]